MATIDALAEQLQAITATLAQMRFELASLRHQQQEIKCSFLARPLSPNFIYPYNLPFQPNPVAHRVPTPNPTASTFARPTPADMVGMK